MGILRRRSSTFRAVFTILYLGIFLFSSIGVGLAASNAGVISGTITDSATHAPISGVRVTAASPSGSYQATSDSHGFFSMTGVYADTYTVAFQATGYEPVSVPGVSVFADQVARVNETMSKSLRTIAQVRARGVSSAYQPNQTTDTVTVAAPQIQNFQGSDFNLSETNLISSLPGAELDSSGYPVIHGGREYEEGFEFEGIPYTDAFTNQFNNSLAIPTAGVSLVQLTPGSGEVNQGTGGGFGTLNVVAKRGTYPAYAQIEGGVGGPAFSHGVNFDFSWATPDGRWSNYLSTANANSAFQFGNGAHPLAQLGSFYSLGLESDREILDNLIFRFGHNNSQSIQAFADIAQHNFYIDAGGIKGLCFYSCDPVFTGTFSGFWGFTPSQVTALSNPYPGQPSVTSTLAQAGNRAPETFWQPNQAYKLEYTNNFNPSTFFTITGYRTNSVVTFDIPSSEGSATRGSWSLQGGQTTGGTITLQKQLSDKNLFQVGADISHLHPVFAFQSEPLAFLSALIGTTDQFTLPYAFISPNDPNCPLQTAFGIPPGPGTTCGAAYANNPSASQLHFPQFFEVASVDRQDYSAYLSDKWTPNDKLNVQGGLRLDMATYRMPAPGIDPFYCTTEYLPTSIAPNPKYDPTKSFEANADAGNCPFTATFSFPNDAVKPKVLQPRIGISYRLGENSSVRVTYNRAVQFVPIGDFDFGETPPNNYIKPYGNLPVYDPINVFLTGTPSTNCGFLTAVSGSSLAVPCRNLGEQLYWINQNTDGIAFQVSRPTTSDNYQVTFQHAFTSGLLNGVAVSVSPWYRNQHDTIAAESSPILTPSGTPLVINGVIQFGPQVVTNNGKEHATGIDFNLTRNVAYGLSGQLTASYINEFSSVIPLSTNEDFYPSVVPASVALGNVYRVGFLSPFQATLALSYRTRSGWRFNPRYTYNIGYPTGVGTLTAADVNAVAYNLPNTNVLPGSAPAGPYAYIDPLNPGSFFKPNIAATRGESETSSPGGKLTPPNGFFDFSLEYAPPNSRFAVGADIFNIFNEVYSGAALSGRYQPIATGISGPLTGFSTSPINYTTYPSAFPHYQPYENATGVWVNFPNNPGRSFFVYMRVRV
jgi:hypothetical protein